MAQRGSAQPWNTGKTLAAHFSHISVYVAMCIHPSRIEGCPLCASKKPWTGDGSPHGRRKQRKSLVYRVAELARLIQVGNTGSGSQMYEYSLDLVAQCQKWRLVMTKENVGPGRCPGQMFFKGYEDDELCASHDLASQFESVFGLD